MYLLGLDLETTGLSPEQDEIIEIGYMMWDTSINGPVLIGGALVKPTVKKLPQIIVELTGITDNQLRDFGMGLKDGLLRLSALASRADYIVAHNGISFDRKFLTNAYTELNLPFPDKYWIDTRTDIAYPRKITTRKLTYLAAEHGIPTANAHRAAFDCMMMMQILSKYDVEEVAKRAATSIYEVTADVNFDDKERAKEMGFHWVAKGKKWKKTYREYDLKRTEFPFATTKELLNEGGIKGV